MSRKAGKNEMKENMGFSIDEISSNFGPVACLLEKNGNQIDYESQLEILLESHENKNVVSSSFPHDLLTDCRYISVILWGD